MICTGVTGETSSWSIVPRSFSLTAAAAGSIPDGGVLATCTGAHENGERWLTRVAPVSLRPVEGRRLWAVLDAQRQELFAAAFNGQRSVFDQRQPATEVLALATDALGLLIVAVRPPVALQPGGLLLILAAGYVVNSASGFQGYVVLSNVPIDDRYSATISLTNAADSVVSYDSRGFGSTGSGVQAKYILRVQNFVDSVCVSQLGLINKRGCGA